MANYVLPIVARTRRGFPHWVDEQIALDHKIDLASDASINAITKGSLLLLGSRENVWSYFPIASGLPANNVDILLRLSKRSLGNESYINSGGAIMLSPTKNTGTSNGYVLSIGSGASSYCSIHDRQPSGSQNQLGSNAISPDIANTSAVILFRARRDGDNVRIKIWHDGSVEPLDWSLSVKDTTYDVTNIGFIIHGRDLIIDLKDIAYATNGDTASFDLPPVVDVVAGSVPNVKNGDIVNIHDVATHDIVDSIALPSSGAWISELYNDRPVYARIERASGSKYDLLFAKYGNTYLGGDYPDGALKDDGVPSTGEVSVLYRSDDPILGGVTIAKVLAAQSGEWRVSGLQPNVPFDVVARKPNRKDALVSSVIGAPDPDFKFALLGQLSNNNDYITGLVLAKGAAEPITPTLLGATPYGFSANDLTVDGNKISSNLPLRDYGNFSFDMRVTDANAKSIDSRINIIDGQRAPFVDFIAAVNSMDRGSAATPITAVIPSSVMPGDILVIGLMRRGSGITISDNNSGAWVLSADVFGSPTYNQGTSIYTRTAKVGDAGKTITVSAPYSGRLIVYLSVYRGKFAPLMVKSGRSGPVRYDNTYSSGEKNLEPITHSSGFLIRAVSSVFTYSDSTAVMAISNMTPTGPTNGNPYRLQVAYAHLSEPGVFTSTYRTAVTNTEDVVPEVSIILDEVRP